MDKSKIHSSICEDLTSVYKAKNADYGDSFAKIREEFPDAILIRLTDKLNRLKTLMNGAEPNVRNESIDDTLLDLANYAIMELIERRINETTPKSEEIHELDGEEYFVLLEEEIEKS